jgi:hypothetical protein
MSPEKQFWQKMVAESEAGCQICAKNERTAVRLRLLWGLGLGINAAVGFLFDISVGRINEGLGLLCLNMAGILLILYFRTRMILLYREKRKTHEKQKLQFESALNQPEENI